MILDGWGKSPDPKVSAIDNANVPFINSLYTQYPNAQLRTDGLNVGLPEGQMGNSEVGHMNLGAGRIVYQDLAKINLAVANKTMSREQPLIDAFHYAKANNKAVHFLGLVYSFARRLHADRDAGPQPAGQIPAAKRMDLAQGWNQYRSFRRAGFVIRRLCHSTHRARKFYGHPGRQRKQLSLRLSSTQSLYFQE